MEVQGSTPEAALTEEEREMAAQYAQQIDLYDSGAVLQYGAGVQKKMADFSEKALENVRTKDLGEIGDLLSGVVTELRDFDEDPEHCYIAERPKVYKRSGDTRIYDSTQIEVRTGGYYRSLHYIIKYHGYYLEIQGRTLFEEGWSEIDHDIVYPYYKDDEMLTEFSGLLNRLSGMADEMSSYFRKMKELREEEPDKK